MVGRGNPSQPKALNHHWVKGSSGLFDPVDGVRMLEAVPYSIRVEPIDRNRGYGTKGRGDLPQRRNPKVAEFRHVALETSLFLGGHPFQGDE
jgi:hypothetical protein